MRRILFMMAEDGERILRSGSAMRKHRGAEGRFPNRTAIKKHTGPCVHLHVVPAADLGKEIVRMLPVHDGKAECSIACLKELRKPPPRNSRRFKAQHRAQRHRLAAE